MAFTEFYCDASSGTDTNGGSDSGSSPSMSDTGGTGSWNATTNVYVSTTTTGSVSVGQWISIYTAGWVYSARITNVSGGSGSAWTITCSSTAIVGSKPSTNTNFNAKVGGAWKGPNGSTVTGGFSNVTTASTDSTGNMPRVNYKGTFSISSGITLSNGGVTHQGYTSTAGDGGKFTIDGSTNTINLLTLSGSCTLADFIIQNNGASGTNAGILINTASINPHLFRGVINTVRGPGLSVTTTNAGATTTVEEVEFYGCNSSNTASSGAVFISAVSNGNHAEFNRCIFHDNSGGNNNGVYASSNGLLTFNNCVFDTNGNDGVLLGSNGLRTVFNNCDFYNNGRDGAEVRVDQAPTIFRNCNFIKNGRYGIEGLGTLSRNIYLVNCGFGAGTQANTTGTVTPTTGVQEIGTVNYASDVTPWVDPANGDFRVTLSTAKAAGRGAFTQTAASYAGTVGYPDIGAAQHQDASSGGGGSYASC